MTQHVAIVTGAGGDIGQAIARRLRQDHTRIVMVDRDLDALERACQTLGEGFLPWPLDVTDAAACADLAAEMSARGGVKTLVNNAGAARATSLHDTSLADWQADRALNLDSAFIMFSALAGHLKDSQGCVVNIASVNGIGVYGHPAYSAAKAGMIHLTRLIAVEYGKYGIRANVVAPGTVRTQAWEARATANPDVFTQAAAHYPLGRIALADDVAQAVGFLASPLAGAITGVCLPVDCGLSAGVPALARTFSQSSSY